MSKTEINKKKIALDGLKAHIKIYLIALQGGKLGNPTLKELNCAGILHRFLEDTENGNLPS